MTHRHSGNYQNMIGGHPPVHPQHGSRPSFGTAVPIPTGHTNGTGRLRNGSVIGGPQQGEMGKSPPNLPNKNTKHVPCKFFRQGQCQAGNACPFLHTQDPMSQQAPCKYFMRGNCKFGAKCMLAHYLPNGHRVSRADLEPNSRRGMNGGINYHDRDPQTFYTHDDQALDEPFSGQFAQPPQPQTSDFPDIAFLDEDPYAHPGGYNPWNQNGRAYEQPPIGSPPGSQYGSPPNETLSPPQSRWPSALDAPLPGSWNNGIPNYKIHGPMGSSMPGRFDPSSPPTSIQPQQKVGSPPTRDAFSRVDSRSSGLKTTPLGTSPALAESSIGERLMPVNRNIQRSKMPMSASVPVHDLEERFGVDADLSYLPGDLHEEVLTPGEKMRRMSKGDQELSSSLKNNSEGLAIPRRSSNIVGSPPAAGSPSRFRAIFEEQQREKTTPNTAQVGSPLRESWMLNGNSSFSNRQAMQMSGISQAMARIELSRTESIESNGLRPNAVRGSYSRQISSPGLNSKRIDEEGEGAFFLMDDESTRSATNSAWFDGQRKVSDETSKQTANGGVAVNRNARPISGFQQ